MPFGYVQAAMLFNFSASWVFVRYSGPSYLLLICAEDKKSLVFFIFLNSVFLVFSFFAKLKLGECLWETMAAGIWFLSKIQSEQETNSRRSIVFAVFRMTTTFVNPSYLKRQPICQNLPNFQWTQQIPEALKICKYLQRNLPSQSLQFFWWHQHLWLHLK